MIKQGVAATFVALMTVPAFAQADFATIDADGSGTLSYEEVAAVFNIDRPTFDAADADGNGALSEAEFAALTQQ